MKNLLHPTHFLPAGLPTVIKLCIEPRAVYKYVNAYIGILEGVRTLFLECIYAIPTVLLNVSFNIGKC